MSADQAGRLAAEGPVVYTLLYPVELRKADGTVAETITELTLNRLKGGDTRRVMNARDKGTGEFIATLVGACARIPPSTFEQLDGADITAAMEIAGAFLGSAPPTSKT